MQRVKTIGESETSIETAQQLRQMFEIHYGMKQPTVTAWD